MNIDIFPNENITWDEWSNQINYLLAQECLPVVDEENWVEFATSVVSTPAFTPFNIKSPDDVDDWRDWARDFFIAVNGVVVQ